ncbi:MAG: ester cyclase [Sphingomonadaceae bacterium]
MTDPAAIDAAAIEAAKARRLALPLVGAGAAWAAHAVPSLAADVAAPVDRLDGADAVAARLLDPVGRAFRHGEERIDILIGGRFEGGLWTASTGHVAGLFEAPLWGIPATGLPAFLRYCRFDRWADGRLVELILLFDLPDLMMQARVWPLCRPLGPFIRPPGPATRDGVVREAGDPAESAASLALVEAMIGGLMAYDGRSLASMGMRRFWHPFFWWFGPAPIGTFCGHADYERGHQGPFLNAFPDRVGGNHRARFAERSYVASTGWPSIRATHLGGGFLGLPATGRPVTMRVMDIWRREGELLRENWVFVDIIDLLRQLGVDLFARMAALAPAAIPPD